MNSARHRPTGNLVHPDDRSTATDQWQAVMTGERASYHCELRMLHKTGTVVWTEVHIPEEIITDAAGNRRWLQTVKRPMLDENGRAIQLVGAASDITARKHVEEELRQREHAFQAALQERELISQELHDGILQSLYAVGLGLETCKSMLHRNPRKAACTLDRTVTQLNTLMREVRNFIAGLESGLLQGGDLAGALRTVVRSIAVPHGLPFRVAIDRQAARHITREQSWHVLNIVREAVSNSLRHAKASCGQVSLRLLKHAVRVTIRDNGIGFTPGRAVGLGHGLHYGGQGQADRGGASRSTPNRNMVPVSYLTCRRSIPCPRLKPEPSVCCWWTIMRSSV